MSEYGDYNLGKSDKDQIFDYDSCLIPDELVCIQVPKILRQFTIRKNLTRNLVLSPEPGLLHPSFALECIKNFHISDIKILSKTVFLSEESNLNKSFELSVGAKYDLLYSDGVNRLIQSDEATFILTLNDISCPRQKIKCFPKDIPGVCPKVIDEDGLIIEMDAFADELWNMLCPCTGALILDIGVFFSVRFVCYKQLVVPTYTHSPPLPEQNDINSKSSMEEVVECPT